MSCCALEMVIDKMNTKGLEWCRANIDSEIVPAVLKHTRHNKRPIRPEAARAIVELVIVTCDGDREPTEAELEAIREWLPGLDESPQTESTE